MDKFEKELTTNYKQATYCPTHRLYFSLGVEATEILDFVCINASSLPLLSVYKRNRAKRENNKKKEKTRKKKRDYFVRQLRKTGLKVEFANLSYLKKVEDDADDVQATDDQYVQFIKLEVRVTG